VRLLNLWRPALTFLDVSFDVSGSGAVSAEKGRFI
jgi:hypothetical protein